MRVGCMSGPARLLIIQYLHFTLLFDLKELTRCMTA